METFNIYKGYGQLIPNTSTDDFDQGYHHNNDNKLLQDRPRKRIIIIATTSILLVTLLLGSALGSLIFESVTEDSEFEPEDSIQYVCTVTQHPDSCISDISSINRRPKPDPLLIFSLSLSAAVNHVSKLTSLPKALISKVNDPRSLSALTDCEELFKDALDRMNQSAAAMAENKGAEGEVVLTEIKIGDLRTWISAAMTDQETCLDGLMEVGSTVVDEVKGAVHGSTVCMSNSLAILANMKTILKKFDQHMH
ncbi:hypothetical protein Dimus_004871 [Dionaea muscipula]